MSDREFLDDQTKRVLQKTPVSDNTLLTFKDLRYIRMAMIDVSVNWYSIGLQLGVDMSILDKIRSEHRRDSDRCLTRVIAEWLKNSSCCTWRKVVIAVSSRVGGDNPKLAGKIATECRMYGSYESFEGLEEVDHRPLRSSDITQVATALSESLADKWDSVGLFLGIPFKVIERCKFEETLNERILELVNAWIGRKYDVDTYGEPSWRNLVEAVAHKAGGYHKRLATQLAADHPVVAEPISQNEPNTPIAGSGTPMAEVRSEALPEGHLTEENDLPRLMNALVSVASKWDTICLQLGVPQRILTNIQAKPMLLLGAPQTYLKEGLCEWFRSRTEEHTIARLADALRTPSVDEPVLAEELEDLLRRDR